MYRFTAFIYTLSLLPRLYLQFVDTMGLVKLVLFCVTNFIFNFIYNVASEEVMISDKNKVKNNKTILIIWQKTRLKTYNI